MRQTLSALTLLMYALLLTACTNKSEETDALTYYRDIAPLLETHCTSCHQPGNIAPFDLTEFEEVYDFREAIAMAVESGTMPPWPPDPACNDYQFDRSLPQDSRDTLVEWARGEAAEGDPQDAPEPDTDDDGQSEPFDYTLTINEPYTPVLTPDDYRCHVVDWPADKALYVTGYEVNPDQASVVHHVIAFALPADAAERYRGYDAAEEGPGYTCFGSPQPTSATGSATDLAGARWLGSWAPGGTERNFPEGTGIRVEPNSVIVMQVHCNTLVAAPVADQSSISFRVAEEVERPALIAPYTNPYWVTGGMAMAIPAGESEVTHSMGWDIISVGLVDYLAGDEPLDDSQGLVIHNVGLHMHELGSSASLSVVGSNGEGECLLSIPEWDFNWQGAYFLEDPFTLKAGDTLNMSCTWDNSAENQKVVDGELLDPQDVEWGEGTQDEMCLGILYLTEP